MVTVQPKHALSLALAFLGGYVLQVTLDRNICAEWWGQTSCSALDRHMIDWFGLFMFFNFCLSGWWVRMSWGNDALQRRFSIVVRMMMWMGFALFPFAGTKDEGGLIRKMPFVQGLVGSFVVIWALTASSRTGAGKCAAPLREPFEVNTSTPLVHWFILLQALYCLGTFFDIQIGRGMGYYVSIPAATGMSAETRAISVWFCIELMKIGAVHMFSASYLTSAQQTEYVKVNLALYVIFEALCRFGGLNAFTPEKAAFEGTVGRAVMFVFGLAAIYQAMTVKKGGRASVSPKSSATKRSRSRTPASRRR